MSLCLENNRPAFAEVNYTRMTLTQATAFDAKYAIVDHHANDATKNKKRGRESLFGCAKYGV